MSVQAGPDAASPAADSQERAGSPASANFRDRRRVSVAEARRRRELLIAEAPNADPQFVNAIAAADSLWGPSERWRTAVNQHLADESSPGGGDDSMASSGDKPTSPSQSKTTTQQPKGLRLIRRRRQIGARRSATGSPRFDIPIPERRSGSVGQARSWVTRLSLIVSPLLLAGGLFYSCGVSTGSSRLVQQASISGQDAAAFHLSSFPAERASAFGVAYLTLCWTHPAAADTVATQNRLAALAQMSSAGVAGGCGWTGTAPAPAPAAITWDGSAVPLEGVYPAGAAAQLGFMVTTADQRTVGVSVPIWMPSPTSTVGARVVGDVAIVPVATAAAAPTPITTAITDPAVAEALTPSVLVPFLRAWAASDPVQLNLVLARDASAAARTGMSGQLSKPVVAGVRVIVIRGDPTSYRDGDQVTAQLTVDWTTASGGQRSGYSIGLRMTAGRWQVTDISGAAADPAGGASPSTTFAAPNTTTPAG